MWSCEQSRMWRMKALGRAWVSGLVNWEQSNIINQHKNINKEEVCKERKLGPFRTWQRMLVGHQVWNIQEQRVNGEINSRKARLSLSRGVTCISEALFWWEERKSSEERVSHLRRIVFGSLENSRVEGIGWRNKMKAGQKNDLRDRRNYSYWC